LSLDADSYTLAANPPTNKIQDRPSRHYMHGGGR